MSNGTIVVGALWGLDHLNKKERIRKLEKVNSDLYQKYAKEREKNSELSRWLANVGHENDMLREAAAQKDAEIDRLKRALETANKKNAALEDKLKPKHQQLKQ